jgi:hypothetical protein
MGIFSREPIVLDEDIVKVLGSESRDRSTDKKILENTPLIRWLQGQDKLERIFYNVHDKRFLVITNVGTTVTQFGKAERGMCHEDVVRTGIRRHADRGFRAEICQDTTYLTEFQVLMEQHMLKYYTYSLGEAQEICSIVDTHMGGS